METSIIYEIFPDFNSRRTCVQYQRIKQIDICWKEKHLVFHLMCDLLKIYYLRFWIFTEKITTLLEFFFSERFFLNDSRNVEQRLKKNRIDLEIIDFRL